MAVQISGNDITVPRDGSFTRNVTIGGTLTYEDVTNIDSVGLVTARTGIEIGARPGVAASISVDGNAIFSGITTATTIKSTTGIVTTLTSTTLNVDGGDATFTGASANIIFDKSDDALEFADNAKAVFGTGADLEIYHNGSNNIIDSNSGNLEITADSFFVNNAANNEVQIKAVADGAVELYHNNTKKIETASGGVTVTGTVAATSFTGSGAALTGISAISMIDSWRITDDTGTGNNQIVQNWASATNLLASNLGSALGYSSGTFSFPSTGHYLMTFVCRFHCGSGNDSEMNAVLKVTTDNSSYSIAAQTGYGAQEGSTKSAGSITYAFDITDTSNQKFQFHTDSMGSTSQLRGNGSVNETYFQMIRLADT